MERRRGLLLLCLLLCVAGSNAADPAAWKEVGRPYAIVSGVLPRPNRTSFERAARLVPPDAALLASNDLAPHFSARRSLGIAHLRRPNPLTPWVILDLSDTRHLESRAEVAAWLATWILTHRYAVRFYQDEILVLERGGRDEHPDREELRAYLARWGREIP